MPPACDQVRMLGLSCMKWLIERSALKSHGLLTVLTACARWRSYRVPKKAEYPSPQLRDVHPGHNDIAAVCSIIGVVCLPDTLTAQWCSLQDFSGSSLHYPLRQAYDSWQAQAIGRSRDTLSLPHRHQALVVVERKQGLHSMDDRYSRNNRRYVGNLARRGRRLWLPQVEHTLICCSLTSEGLNLLA